MCVAFANAKATHIFSAKILAYMRYLMIKVLMITNWAQYFWAGKSVLSGAMLIISKKISKGTDQYANMVQTHLTV